MITKPCILFRLRRRLVVATAAALYITECWDFNVTFQQFSYAHSHKSMLIHLAHRAPYSLDSLRHVWLSRIVSVSLCFIHCLGVFKRRARATYAQGTSLCCSTHWTWCWYGQRSKQSPLQGIQVIVHSSWNSGLAWKSVSFPWSV